ncbi:MAG: hypothetical protein KGY74_01010 [Candidatus Cloacimonetes bacterium]|nr:hypothetical protein [Candidatus Cloacimonadota bacterium]
MHAKRIITILVILIVLISAITTLTGILSEAGPGRFEYESIRGKTVIICGEGIYKHMSADVAVQGIAQDYVTLFIGIPLLLISLWGYRKNNNRSRFLLAGTLSYFFVTYLFYTAMGMYNYLFLAYVVLMEVSFFALFNVLNSFQLNDVPELFREKTPSKFVGGFLIVNSVAIALLWLSVVVPPLLDSSIYPDALQHYTTLIVQGFDLGLLLPIGFVSGILLIKRTSLGYLIGTTYIIFLALLMTSLTAKIIGMASVEVNVIPSIFIIPAFNIISILSSYLMLSNIKKTEKEPQ